MACCISFYFEKRMLIVLIYSITSFIFKSIEEEFNYFYFYPLFKSSEIFSFILFLIEKKNYNNEEKTKEEEEDDDDIIIKEEEKVLYFFPYISYLYIIFYILIMILFSFLEYFIFVKSLDRKQGIYQNSLAFSLIPIIIIEKILKSKQFYSHHYLSFILMFIHILFTLIYFILAKEYKEYLSCFIISMIYFFLYGIKLSLYSYMIDMLFFNGYSILIIEGIINFFIFVIMFLNFKKMKEEFKNLVNNEDNDMIFFVIELLLYYINSVLKINILKKLNSNLIITGDIFSMFLFYSIYYYLIYFPNFSKKDLEKKKLKMNISIPQTIILLFASFIYGEIFILNCCKLNKNVRKNIMKRSEIDQNFNENFLLHSFIES